MKISKKGTFIVPGAYSWKHQLCGDPDGPMDGDADDIESALVFSPRYVTENLDILEGKEIGKKKQSRKLLDGYMLFGFGYICRNYELGHLDSAQIEQFETIMLELALLLERLKRNKVKIPTNVMKQLKTMGLLDNK